MAVTDEMTTSERIREFQRLGEKMKPQAAKGDRLAQILMEAARIAEEEVRSEQAERE